MIQILAALLPTVLGLIDKVIPDKQAADKLKLEIIKAEQEGRLKEFEKHIEVALAQLEVNKVEAGSGNLFTSGWRPAVGWICTLGLGFQFLLLPLLNMILSIFGYGQLPHADMELLMTLLFGMLGLGAYRSYDKKVQKNLDIDKKLFYNSLRNSLGGSLSQTTVDQVEKAFRDSIR